jgi:hypothetical protein
VWNEAMKGHGIARSQRSPRHRPPTPSAPPPAALGRILSSLARLERRYDALSSLLHMYMGGWDQSPSSCPYGSYSGSASLRPPAGLSSSWRPPSSMTAPAASATAARDRDTVGSMAIAVTGRSTE